LDRNGVFNRAIWYKFSTIILNAIKGAAIIWAGSQLPWVGDRVNQKFIIWTGLVTAATLIAMGQAI